MIISITDAVRETTVVIVGLILALVISARISKDHGLFPPQTTTELKGLAILIIVFSHIGYFLVNDHRFLTPLSYYAGIGVDLFFILSGYGLVAAALRRPLSIGQFYLRRLHRIYTPVIITLLLFLLLDRLWLHQTYPLKTVIENLLGLFPRADLYKDIDSPLWYITPLLAYYLLFPLIFRRRWPAISAVLTAVAGWLIILHVPKLNVISVDLIKFYKLHYLSFPLGMLLAAWLNQPFAVVTTTAKRLATLFNQLHLATILRWLAIIIAGGVFLYIHYHPQVGEKWTTEAAVSLIAAMAIIIIFLCKKINFKILTLFGLFSFEIYLLHWPLLYRYNFLYGRLPAGTATILYLALFVGLGYLYQKMITQISSIIGTHPLLDKSVKRPILPR
ncbi:MAG: acyltransferase [bacterium]|nr:acyltransferase [bacterium]